MSARISRITQLPKIRHPDHEILTTADLNHTIKFSDPSIANNTHPPEDNISIRDDDNSNDSSNGYSYYNENIYINEQVEDFGYILWKSQKVISRVCEVYICYERLRESCERVISGWTKCGGLYNLDVQRIKDKLGTRHKP